MTTKSAIIRADSRKFKEIILENSRNDWILVDFYASWCGPCKKIAPKLKELARKYPHVTFMKVDIEKCPDLAHDYLIQSLPTFLLFSNGSFSVKAPPIQGARVDKVEALIKERCK
jgi:thioredoxin 1